MTTIRHAFAIALALFVVAACATTQEAPRREAPPSSPTFLWKVSAADRPGTIYLLGTVHLRDAESATLDQAVLDTVDGADRLAFEIVPDTVNEASIGALTQELGLLPEGESLLTRLDDDTQQKLAAATEKLGLGVAVFERMRPWLASLSLSLLRMQLDGFSAESGVERLLHARVRAAGEKQMVSLETPEEQLRLFAGLSPETELEMLRQSLDEIERSSSQIADIQRAYQQGDNGALEALMFAERGKSAEGDALYRAMFDERNERMVERLLPWFDADERTVVAVGAGHMLGDAGLPALLLAKGFTVEAVPALGHAPVRPASRSGSGAFHDEELGFSAEFHVTPDVARQPVTTPDGHTSDFIAVTAKGQMVELTVVVNRFPGPLDADPARVDPLFTAMLERMGQQFGGLESSERLSVQGLPAARFTTRSPMYVVNGLVILRGARMYTVLGSRYGEAEGETLAAQDAIVRRFFESFRLLDLDETPGS